MNFYNKRNYFNFANVNLPAAPAYRVNISQGIRYSSACSSYYGFLDEGVIANKTATKPRVISG